MPRCHRRDVLSDAVLAIDSAAGSKSDEHVVVLHRAQGRIQAAS